MNSTSTTNYILHWLSCRKIRTAQSNTLIKVGSIKLVPASASRAGLKPHCLVDKVLSQSPISVPKGIPFCGLGSREVSTTGLAPTYFLQVAFLILVLPMKVPSHVPGRIAARRIYLMEPLV